jgi:hypothetical protein
MIEINIPHALSLEDPLRYYLSVPPAHHKLNVCMYEFRYIEKVFVNTTKRSPADIAKPCHMIVLVLDEVCHHYLSQPASVCFPFVAWLRLTPLASLARITKSRYDGSIRGTGALLLVFRL